MFINLGTIIMDSFVSACIDGRKATVDHIKNIYGTTCRLILGPKRNKTTVHYKCSYEDCKFEIVFRHKQQQYSDNNRIDNDLEVYHIIENECFLQHIVVNAIGKVIGLCGATAKLSTVSQYITCCIYIYIYS